MKECVRACVRTLICTRVRSIDLFFLISLVCASRPRVGFVLVCVGCSFFFHFCSRMLHFIQWCFSIMPIQGSGWD